MIEIPLGWRRLRDDERVIEGDKFWLKENQFDFSENWERGSSIQSACAKPYIRPLDNEWHEHDGGEMPVNCDEVVSYRMLNGSGQDSCKANLLRWEKLLRETDISKYRRHQPAEQLQPLTEPHMTGTTMETMFRFVRTLGVDVQSSSGESVLKVFIDDDQVVNLPSKVSVHLLDELIKALEMLK